jgi:hypothetical protein
MIQTLSKWTRLSSNGQSYVKYGARSPKFIWAPCAQLSLYFKTLLRSPGIDSQPGGPVRHPYLSYWPARLQRLEESIPRNRFLCSLNVYKYGLCTHCLRPRHTHPPPLPPHFGSYTRALLVKIDDISLWPPVYSSIRKFLGTSNW